MMTIILAKAFYNRALARIALREEAEAEKDLVEATKNNGDESLFNELRKLRERIKQNKEREKAKFKKLFSEE